jgi:hypothetical protein
MRNYMRPLKFLLAIILLNIQAVGQTTIQVVIKNLSGHKIDKVDVFDISGIESHEYIYNDTIISNFKKSNIDCYNIRYFENGKMFRQQLWLDTGKIDIEAHIDSSRLIIDTVINSPMFYKYKAFTKKYSQLYKSNDTAVLNSFLLETYRVNIENPFSLLVGNLYVGINQNLKPNLLNLKILTERQGEKFSWFFFYESVNERLNKILSISKINLSEFSFINKANKKIKPSLKGADYYILDLWFLACPPCIQDHKIINTTLPQLKEKKIELISISTDKNSKEWKMYLDKNNYKWQNYLETLENTFTNYLSIPSYPTYIILDNLGNIIDTYNSFSDVITKFDIKE